MKSGLYQNDINYVTEVARNTCEDRAFQALASLLSSTATGA